MVLPDDDVACGVVLCSTLSTTCRSFSDLTAHRCQSLGVCVTAVPAVCTEYLDAPPSTACTCVDVDMGLCEEGACVCAAHDGGLDALLDSGSPSDRLADRDQGPIDAEADTHTGGEDASVGPDGPGCDGPAVPDGGERADVGAGSDAGAGWEIATLCGCDVGSGGRAPFAALVVALALPCRRRARATLRAA